MEQRAQQLITFLIIMMQTMITTKVDIMTNMVNGKQDTMMNMVNGYLVIIQLVVVKAWIQNAGKNIMMIHMNAVIFSILSHLQRNGNLHQDLLVVMTILVSRLLVILHKKMKEKQSFQLKLILSMLTHIQTQRMTIVISFHF